MARRILIAEDEPSIVVSLEFLLRGAGHEVRVARDGEEALRLVASEAPDLVVLDVMLPAVSGFEVCRRIREGAAGKAIRVLMLTARGRGPEMEKGMAAGADAYMTKPFATRDLVRAVADLLGEETR
ncbi:MAG: response regulator [Burkholderiales bacterium]|nr:response regulator [Burkholderiales bacterium]